MLAAECFQQNGAWCNGNMLDLGSSDSGFESRRPDIVSLTFKKTKEDFICEICGTAAQGTGFTNHCPKCLWSKHVDVNPGDRAEKCGGMMKPIRVAGDQKKYFLIHKCEICGAERRNRGELDDNFDEVLAVAKKTPLP